MSISPIVLHPKTKQTPSNLLQKTHSSPPQNAHGKQTKNHSTILTIKLSSKSHKSTRLTFPREEEEEEEEDEEAHQEQQHYFKRTFTPKKKSFFFCFFFFSFFFLTCPSMHLEVSAALSFG
jgi:hypothetical protein